ncbi:hypothetical protein P7L66_03960 (plasmid) [Tistrella mobilis]|uniref:hypothetical protein n=1 Tax=Tistrella mobilis TaxID=171437 RepID=UPI0035587D30
MREQGSWRPELLTIAILAMCLVGLVAGGRLAAPLIVPPERHAVGVEELAVLSDSLDAMLEADLVLTVGICFATGYLLLLAHRSTARLPARRRLMAGAVVFICAFLSQSLAIKARMLFQAQVFHGNVEVDAVHALIAWHVIWLALAAFGLLYVALTALQDRGGADESRS